MAGVQVTSDEESLWYPGWRVVLGSVIALAFGPSTIAVLGLGLFIRPLEADFHWPRTEIALATTIISYMIVVISPLQGLLIDRFGARRVMLPSIPAFAIGIAALSLLPPVHWIYYAAWAVIPILGMGLFPLTYLRTVSTWFQRRLGLALGIANAGVALGGALVPLIAGALIAHYGWRSAYLGLAAIVMFVTFPVAWWLVREVREDRELSAVVAVPAGLTFKEAARTPAFALLSAGFLLLGVINTALIVHQTPLLLDAGMKPGRVAAVQTVFGIFGLLGRLLTGLLLDILPAQLLMIGFVIGAGVACALYASGVHGDVAFLCAALIGLVFGAEFDVLAYMIKRGFGVRAFGKIYGAIFAIFQFGAGCGAALLPMSRDWFGSYRPGLWGFTGLMALCALVFLFVRSHKAVETPVAA
jgi:MFS family permease